MPTIPTRFRAAATAAILVALTATLTGCQSPVVARTGGSAAEAPTSAAAGSGTPPPAAAASAGSDEGGAGTVTLSITEPVQVSGHAGASVTCTNRVRSYTAEAASVTVDGYQLSFTIRVAPYTNPGTYQSLVTMRLDNPSGVVTTVSATPQVPATITTDGGSYQINATSENGRHLTASITWKCS